MATDLGMLRKIWCSRDRVRPFPPFSASNGLGENTFLQTCESWRVCERSSSNDEREQPAITIASCPVDCGVPKPVDLERTDSEVDEETKELGRLRINGQMQEITTMRVQDIGCSTAFEQHFHSRYFACCRCQHQGSGALLLVGIELAAPF